MATLFEQNRLPHSLSHLLYSRFTDYNSPQSSRTSYEVQGDKAKKDTDTRRKYSISISIHSQY